MLPRKSKIRPPRRLTAAVLFETLWPVLATAIAQIQNRDASQLSFEELYRRLYGLVLRKYGQRLYDAVAAVISAHLGGVEQALETAGGTDLLSAAVEAWQAHALSMRMISDVLMYLDRVYVRERRLPLVYDMGVALFRDQVVGPLGGRLVEAIVAEFTLIRTGAGSRDVFRQAVLMCEQLVEDGEAGESFYLRTVEPELLQSTAVYAEAQSHGWLAAGDPFLVRATALWRDEEARVAALPPPTRPRIMAVVGRVIVSDKLALVMDQPDGLAQWLRDDMYHELAMVWSLSGHVDAQHHLVCLRLAGAVQQYSELVRGEPAEAAPRLKKDTHVAKAVAWVDGVVALMAKLGEIVVRAWENSPVAVASVDSAVKAHVGRCDRAAENLALYTDFHLKRLGKLGGDEGALALAVRVFRHVDDRDTFERFYKQHLARRLLQGRLAEEHEASMLQQLRAETGTDFTAKLEGMFRDMQVLRGLGREFRETHADPLEVRMLTTTFWPMQPAASGVVYPAAMAQAQRHFEEFYGAKHSGRLVTWMPAFGNVEVVIPFASRTHEVSMLTYAAVVVLLFQQHDSLTYTEIKGLTHIPEPELSRQLQLLAVAPRTRILEKRPMLKEVAALDVFSLNHKFTAPLTKVKVLTVAALKSEVEQERADTTAEVVKLRKLETDAAVVRVMKARKQLSHNELMAETIRQVSHRFRPTPQLIKQRIDTLLDREYLRRDADNRAVYHYVA